MDTVTYPTDYVTDFIVEKFIAWRADFNTETALLRKFNVNWTPTLIFMDKKGTEHYRLLGFLPPEAFIAHLMLALAKIAFETSQYAEAAELFDRIVRDHPVSEQVPQAIYFRGVSRKKLTKDDSYLDKTAEELKDSFPDSEWTMRTDPW
jgi:thioredoxin-related protein